MEYEVKVTARDRTSKRLDMVKWLMANTNWHIRPTASELMYIVDCILKGETWRPDYALIDRKAYELSPYFNVEFVKIEDPWAERIALQESYWELCRKGAAGDAEAAMAFCKLEMENKVNHGAYA